VRTNFSASVEALALLAITLPSALLLRESSLWFLIPFALITLQRRDYTEYGLDLWSRARWGGVRFHVLNVGVVFGAYALGHVLLARWFFGQHFNLQLPEHPYWLLVNQLLAVALPEEFFFRGYLQTQLNRSFGRPFVLLGARVGIGLPVAAALFALCHVPLGGATQLIVFFPGLWYGWLRERTDGIAVPIVYHALSNVLMRVILTSLA